MTQWERVVSMQWHPIHTKQQRNNGNGANEHHRNGWTIFVNFKLNLFFVSCPRRPVSKCAPLIFLSISWRSNGKCKRVAGRNLITSSQRPNAHTHSSSPRNTHLITAFNGRWSTENAFVFFFVSHSLDMFILIFAFVLMCFACRTSLRWCVYTRHGGLGRLYCQFEYKWFCQPNEIEVCPFRNRNTHTKKNKYTKRTGRIGGDRATTNSPRGNTLKTNSVSN